MGQANQKGTYEKRVLNALSKTASVNESYKGKIPQIVLDNITINETDTARTMKLNNHDKFYRTNPKLEKEPKLYNAYNKCDSCEKETYFVHDIKTIDNFDDEFNFTLGICESCGFKSLLQTITHKELSKEMREHNEFLDKLKNNPRVRVHNV